MIWNIPAKTFLVGEYVALAGGPALILTTKPYFQVGLTGESVQSSIHEDSPAGQLWGKSEFSESLTWNDPYDGLGGFGASSAQFLGAFYAQAFLKKKIVTDDELLDAYFTCAWQGKGVRPSGYDVLAQHMQGCVYLHREKNEALSFEWPFTDISFELIHTRHKLPTHHHLVELSLPEAMGQLARLVLSAKHSFLTVDAEQLIDAVNDYYEQLNEMHLVAEHTISMINQLKKDPDVLAIKGCGALGADVLLILTPTVSRKTLRKRLLKQGYNIVT